MSRGIIEPIGGKARRFLRLARHCHGVAFVCSSEDRKQAKICRGVGYLEPSAIFPATIMHVTPKGVAYLDRLARCE